MDLCMPSLIDSAGELTEGRHARSNPIVPENQSFCWKSGDRSGQFSGSMRRLASRRGGVFGVCDRQSVGTAYASANED